MRPCIETHQPAIYKRNRRFAAWTATKQVQLADRAGLEPGISAYKSGAHSNAPGL